MFSPAEPYFDRLIRLLDLEAEAEKQEALLDMQRFSSTEAEASGTTLTNLVIRDEDTGFGGRILLTFGKRNQNVSLPWTRLGSGTPVLLSEDGTSGWRGIVTQLHKNEIQVAFETWPESESDQPIFRLDRSNDEISRKRQRQGLENARRASNSRFADLRDVLLGKCTPCFNPIKAITPFNSTLNASQWEAVRFAFSAEDIAIIHGPPGTGKTTTVVELIQQLIHSGQRVLAVAPSNLGVDNVLEKLIAAGEEPIRLGHPARVLPELRDHTLDLMVEEHDDGRLARKLRKEAYSLREKAEKYTRAKPLPGERREKRQEAKQMLAEARQIEDQLVSRILSSARVVCATLTGLDQTLMAEQHFDWCIVDESSQSTEAAAWAAIQFADRLVLAGDHFQLPPTVISPQAAAEGFNISLMEQLLTQVGPNISHRLSVQYRMHQNIMKFSSLEFYEDSLVSDPIVGKNLLKDLPDVTTNELTETPIHFIDTAGASYDESLEPDGDSRFNQQEAELVVKKVQALLDAGLLPTDIAIISPYSAQVRLLRELLSLPEIEIDSVDGFQGREKETVIVSMVRSNFDNEIGFLADVRRMNVALTRARRKLIVIGDSATIAVHPFYQRLISYFESVDAYHSIWEYAV
ncbi:MAG: DNA-binding protein [Anaerolineaceae bacterium]|nr:DNA-binding protein [Anaerolineaceae bacterium]